MDTSKVKPEYFSNKDLFRKWLKKNHDTHTELWVGFKKVSSNEASITWPESVEEAISFGWIDGLRKSVDEKSYMIRFTPRRANSIWSAVNIKLIEKLRSEGRLEKAGLDAWENRNHENKNKYSFEQDGISLPKEYENEIRKNKKAWNFFNSLTPSVKNPSIWWVVSAKKEETRLKRLKILITCSESRERIPQLVRLSPKKGI